MSPIRSDTAGDRSGKIGAVAGTSGSKAMPKKVVAKKKWEKELANISIREDVMNKLVLNYLVTEGYAEAAEKFRLESGTHSEIDVAAITDRLLVRKSLMEGNVEDAIEKINDLNPEILDTNPLLFFHLQLQRYIELVRQGEIQKALELSAEVIAPLGEANPHFLGELEETVSLICFDDMATCPVKELMDQAQRNKRAGEVNAAILTSHNREKDPRLQTLLKMLIWAESELKERNFFQDILDLSESTVQYGSIKGSMELKIAPV